MRYFRTFIPLLLFYLLPLGAIAQDTTALEPICRLPVQDILSLENDLLIASEPYYDNDGSAESESLFVYDISNPSEPVIIDRGFRISVPDHHLHCWYEDWHTDALILDSLIVTCTTHRHFLGDTPPFGRRDGPVELLGRWIGAEENLWEIMIQEEIYQEFEDPDGGENYRHPGNMVIYENYLILAAGSWGVRIYDLSSPEEPEEVNVLEYYIDKTVLVDDRLLVYERNNLILLDISDPEVPEAIGQLEIRNDEYPYDYPSVALGGNVFLRNYPALQQEASILVLDLIAEDSPIEVARVDLDRELRWYLFQIMNDKLYIKDGFSTNLDIFSLTEDYNIEYERTITVADGDYRQFLTYKDLLILNFRYQRHSLIYDLNSESVPNTQFILYPSSTNLSAYPNPFNSSTTITYSLPYPTDMSLIVYDQLGREVTSLFEGYNQAGIHSVSVSADELPSGLYFVRLEAGSNVDVRKIVLMR
jgi:hypothetical protein